MTRNTEKVRRKRRRKKSERERTSCGRMGGSKRTRRGE